ncbi:MAG: mandelate racemase/muconate lactonizing enzyme family protein [Acidobacteria bacterium]|nr:mandelate racemase/muconate lactonizing enzyme family protein [Acidobacteriota bacterium]
MQRRTFLTLAASLAAPSFAALPKAKITRVRCYKSPGDAARRPSKVPPLFNQSTNVVIIETDAGLSGIGEGGSKDTLEQCAAALIGRDPFRIEDNWQIVFRGYFYPAGREKLHALGALDMALWDLKAKALGVPLYQLFGGAAREHVECYATGYPNKGSLRETARACVEDGYRAFRIGPADSNPWDRFETTQRTAQMCREVREGVGKDGAWAVDLHTRFDFADGVRLAKQIEPLAPYFVEDLVRSENPDLYKVLRPQTSVPIAVGEQFGSKWDLNMLVENHLIDYARVTVPNVGGITEFLKIMAMCETHSVGLIPHFTGPISEAALVHLCGAFSGPALMEMLPRATSGFSYLPQCFDFKNGKLWLNDRPGLGVTFDEKQLPLLAEITEAAQPTPIYRRPDGSVTNW